MSDQSPHQRSREVRTLFVVFRRYWWFILLVTSIAIAGTYFLTQRQESTYQTSAEVLLRTASSDFLFPFAESAPRTLLRSDNIEQLYTESPGFRSIVNPATPSGVSVRVRTSSPRLTFVATGSDPEALAAGANIWASTYVEARQADIEQSTRDEIEFLEAAIAELEIIRSEIRVDVDRLDELIEESEDSDELSQLLARKVSLEALLQPQLAPIEQELAELQGGLSSLVQRTRFFGPEVGARVESTASVPSTPISPNLMRNLIFGTALGLMFGVAAPFIRVTAAGRLESRDEIDESTELFTLAHIPKYKAPTETSIEVLDRPESVASAQYQALLTAIEFQSIDSPISDLMVSSAVSGDGKTTVALNLAGLAANHMNVLLVDGDLRRPNVAERVGIPNDVGLADVLRGMPVADARHTVNRDGVSFDVLAAGSTTRDPALLLRGPRWSDVVNSKLFLYDLVIVDAPPALAVTDALLLGASLDAQILVTRTQGTRRSELAEAANLLSTNATRTLGVVVNQDRSAHSRYSYYGPD